MDAKDLGELIARRMEEENPDLIRDVRRLVNKKIERPWYVRFYEGVKELLYRDKKY